jgi:hypothetical protein
MAARIPQYRPLFIEEDERIKDTRDLEKGGRENVLRDITPVEWEDMRKLARGQIGGISSTYYMHKIGYQKYYQIIQAIRDEDRNIEETGARVTDEMETENEVIHQVNTLRTTTFENLHKMSEPLRVVSQTCRTLRPFPPRVERRVGPDNATRNRFFTTSSMLSEGGRGIYGDHWHPAMERDVRYGQPEIRWVKALAKEWHYDAPYKFTQGDRVGDKYQDQYHAGFSFNKQKQGMDAVFKPLGLVRWNYAKQ